LSTTATFTQNVGATTVDGSTLTAANVYVRGSDSSSDTGVLTIKNGSTVNAAMQVSNNGVVYDTNSTINGSVYNNTSSFFLEGTDTVNGFFANAGTMQIGNGTNNTVLDITGDYYVNYTGLTTIALGSTINTPAYYSYGGNTRVNGILNSDVINVANSTLTFGSQGLLSNTTGTLSVDGDGFLDLAGTDQTVGALNGANYNGYRGPVFGIIRNNVGGTSTLTVGNGDANGEFDGYILDNTNSSTGIVALIKVGTGTEILGGTFDYTGYTNNYSGGTTINAGTLRLAGSGTLGNTTATLTINGGLLDLNGTNQTVGALNGPGGTIANNFPPPYVDRPDKANTPNPQTGGDDVILTVGNGDANGTYSGTITNNTNNTPNTVALTKVGAGAQTLKGANTYSGVTTINAGALTLDSAGSTDARLANTTNIVVNGGGTLLLANSSATPSKDRINDSATMTLNGGTFNTGGLSEHALAGSAVTQGIGALTLQDNSIIDLANGASILAFANSSGQEWNGTLSIYNWTGIPVIGNGTDQLFFGTDATGLTLAQLNSVSFYSDAGSTFLGSAVFAIGLDGEIVPTGLAPVPEPSTWLAGGLAFATIAFSQRRRFTRQRSQRSRST